MEIFIILYLNVIKNPCRFSLDGNVCYSAFERHQEPLPFRPRWKSLLFCFLTSSRILWTSTLVGRIDVSSCMEKFMILYFDLIKNPEDIDTGGTHGHFALNGT